MDRFSRMVSRAILPGMGDSRESTQATAIGSDEEVLVGAEALFGLLHVHATVVRAIDEALDEEHDTGLTGYELLIRLARLHPDGASVRYLSDQVVVSPSRVSRVAEEFVGRGLLERAVSPHDGRLSLVRLTPAGREALAGMEETFAGALTTHFLNLLSHEQVLSLGAIAHRLGAPNCRELADGG
jgi:DNA-binding MarR family transcriptional regulator